MVQLATRNVTLERGGKTIAVLPDLDVPAGAAIAIVGASGSGKTTALMAMTGIRSPASGEIAIAATDIWKLNRRQRDLFRGKRIGLVFQSFHLIDALTVADNLTIAGRCADVPQDAGRAEYLMEQLGIAALRHTRADRISYGQAQRVAVARALFNKPAVVLADEPTSALDDANARSLLTLLKDAARSEGAALVIATHDRRVLNSVDGVVEMVPPQ